MSEPKPYHRQQYTCVNCGGLGAIGILQDGEMRYGRCLCEAGEANYKGMPAVSGVQYPFRSDGKMAASGEEVEGLDF
jgi:hypothetical protein